SDSEKRVAKLQRELNSAKKALDATKAELKECKKAIKNMQKENKKKEPVKKLTKRQQSLLSKLSEAIDSGSSLSELLLDLGRG
ncbi:MAG: hypothetical protein ACI3ZD_03305, partial [Prevotella sp.]